MLSNKQSDNSGYNLQVKSLRDVVGVYNTDGTWVNCRFFWTFENNRWKLDWNSERHKSDYVFPSSIPFDY